MKGLRFLIVPLALWLAVFWIPRGALADEYDDSQSHPLRVIAYTLYPAALLTEWLIFRPFHFLVSATKPQEKIFGHNPHPPLFAEPEPVYDYGTPRRVPMRETPAPKRSSYQEPVSERVTIQEVPVEKTVYKEVPKIVEVERIVFPDIAFQFNSAELTDLGKGKAYLAAQKLKEKPEIVVAIEGHADYIGDDGYNQKLGLRRGERVLRELAQLGVDTSRMSVTSFGESKPVLDQQTDWARAVNRRVEFRIATP